MEINELTTKLRRLNIKKIIGIFFLIPPILGVLFFMIELFYGDGENSVSAITGLETLVYNWNGAVFYSGDAGGGFTPAVPIYLGLMAIAGAMLLKETEKEKIKH